MSDADSKKEYVEAWIHKQTSSNPATTGHQLVTISIVIPAYNEARRLPPTLVDMIDFFDSRKVSYEIIVVDDGSRDGTEDVVKKFQRIRPTVRLIRLPQNHGKGHAVRTGVLNATGQRILFADADGSTPIGEFLRLDAALDTGFDCAIGSRAKKSDETVVKTRWYRLVLGRIFNGCVNLVLLPGIADTQCGFKLFTAQSARFLFERQRANRYSFDVEILYLARLAGIKVVEVPISWHNVPGSKVNLILDSARMLRDVFVFRWRHRAIEPVATK